METDSKPVLIFDGDCTFCRYWVARWKHATGDRIEYASSQEAGDRYPQIPPEKFDESIQLVERDGSVYQGAEAVFRALAHGPGWRWPLGLYRKFPAAAAVTEWAYRLVARHRTAFGWISRWIWEKEFVPPSYFLVRKLFLGILGFIYFAAFLSLWTQVEGLIGSRGILPLSEIFQALENKLGAERYWMFPTLFWIGSGDGFLAILCLAGAGLSLCLMTGIFPALVLFLLWLIYLSFVTVGQVFMSFQWDTLLLETGLLAVFFAPFQMRPRLASEPRPPTLVLFLLRLLLFKVMFSSGMVKLLSGDSAWEHLVALQFHYETQPLATWIGWYAHQLPAWFQEVSTVGVFIIELVVPFLIFAPRRLRLFACSLMIALQGLIMITGNYCFFNLLTIALCLLLLDDACLKKFLPKWIPTGDAASKRAAEPLLKRIVAGALAALIIFVSFSFQLVPLLVRDLEYPGPVNAVYSWVRPFHSINPYGLFAVMTLSRPEIIVEGSDDLKDWKAYGFKWKPGDPKRRPGFVAPHQPRLDWQMWFAALGNYERNPWFIRFVVRLLQGSEEVLALIGHNPFPEKPPRYIRAVVYEYQFTNFEERKTDGAWWKRELQGMYAPILQLPQSQ